jgi:dienelactone hydrolase
MHGATVQIAIDPNPFSFDQPVAVSVSGLAAGQAVLLRSRLLREDDRWWSGSASFVADPAGCVDLTRDAPREGAYEGIDPMGLFWAMRPEGDSWNEPPARDEAEVHFQAEVDGRVVATAMAERRWLVDGATTRAVEARGLVGRLAEPPGPGPHPAVIVLHGSGPMLEIDIATLLTRYGFAALALQYFGAPELPETLAEVPLEYFETALDWLADQPRVRPERFGAIGRSRGGELALLLGAFLPRVRAVVAYAPSHVVWRRGGTRSAWTHRGEPLPAVPPLPSKQPPVPPHVPYAMTPDNLDRLEDRAAEAAAAIPVERIDGPVMLISGGDDALWPSALMAERVAARLAAHNHPYPVENLLYPGAGHAIAPPYAPPTLDVFHPVSRRMLALGGTPAAGAHANADHWPRVVRFLTESLR